MTQTNDSSGNFSGGTPSYEYGIPPRPPAPGSPFPPSGDSTAPPKKKKKKLLIAAAIVGGVLVVGGITNVVNKAGDDTSSDTASVSSPSATPTVAAVKPASTPTPTPTPTVDPRVAVPDVMGRTIAEARVALESVGLTLVAPAGLSDAAVVTSQGTAATTKVEPGATVEVTAKEPEPEMSVSQRNALKKAKSYISVMAFSHSGLVSQLEFEGFSYEDSVFGADNCGADWNAQAAKKAQDYLDIMGFSRDGLYDQLEFEGFSHEQIEFGLASVGY